MQHCPTCQARYTSDAQVCPLDGTTLEAIHDPMVGRTIGGRYVVSELIGTGGMGTVYRGRHQLVGRDVALKFLAPRLARDPSARERFLREARAANRIDHEHIIDITDVGETSDGLVFLVMEYLEGAPLARIIEEGPLSPQRALNIAHQLATALARAHELDVIHRDIKPDNIFVLQRRGGDFVKLLDFGLAKVIGEHRLTATGKVFGTPEYLAPEQARGEALTGQADQYALGCVLYEMLTGRLPFEGPSPEVVLKHLTTPPLPPSSLRPGLPQAHKLDALVLRMLEKHPSSRFADAYHLADELSALLEDLQGGRASAPPRRSGTVSVPPIEAQVTQPWLDAAEETWAARVELYQSMLPRAYPSGVPPQEVRDGLSEMVRLLEHARVLRRAYGETLLRAKEHEDNVRAARMRMGRAIDELGQDESRAARRIAEAREALELAEARLDELTRPLERGLEAVRHEPASIDVTLVERLRALGGQAALWLEAEAQLPALEARLKAAEREQEDLAFQVAQIKGRLGIVSAEAEGELAAMREQGEALEAELSRTLDAVRAASEPVVRALSAVPSLREMLSGGRNSAAGKGAASRG